MIVLYCDGKFSSSTIDSSASTGSLSTASSSSPAKLVTRLVQLQSTEHNTQFDTLQTFLCSRASCMYSYLRYSHSIVTMIGSRRGEDAGQSMVLPYGKLK